MIWCLSYLISSRFPLMYLSASHHSSIIPSFCRRRCWRLVCCACLSISCCVASLFCRRVLFRLFLFVPHSNRIAHSGSFGFVYSFLSGYIFRAFSLSSHCGCSVHSFQSCCASCSSFVPLFFRVLGIPLLISLGVVVIPRCRILVAPFSAGIGCLYFSAAL